MRARNLRFPKGQKHHLQSKDHILVDLLTKNPSSLPSDPFNLTIPESTLTIRFFHYGPSMNADFTKAALASTANDCLEVHHLPDEAKRKGKFNYHIRAGFLPEAQLNLLVKGLIIWEMWYLTVGGIMGLLIKWKYVGLEFDVLEDGSTEPLAVGMLVEKKTYTEVR